MIVAFIRGEEFSDYGGFSKRRSCCTLLHNTGYVIIDEDGIPIIKNQLGSKEIPSGYSKHLETGKDRIISVAKTRANYLSKYFISNS